MIRSDSGRGKLVIGLGGAVLAAAILAGCPPWNRRASVIQVDPTKAYIDARYQLRQAAEDEDPFTRSHAMEALAQALGPKAGGILKQALGDPEASVRFAAAMAIGDVRYAPAKADLIRMAKLAGPDKRVYCAVIYALHNLGDDTYTGDLSRLLTEHREPQIRANAALVMGKMDEPSAVGPLKMMLEHEQDNLVKVNVVEALAMLGDTRHERMLEAYTKGYDVGIRLIAIRSLGRGRSIQAARVLQELLHERNPAQVRVVSAAELGKLSQADARAYALCVRAVTDPNAVIASSSRQRGFDTDRSRPHVLRHLAAIALGWMDRPAAANVLHPLLRSPHGQVRVAAAMSLIRILKQPEAEPPMVKKLGTPEEPEEDDKDVEEAPTTAPDKSSQPASMPTRKLHSAGAHD